MSTLPTRLRIHEVGGTLNGRWHYKYFASFEEANKYIDVMERKHGRRACLGLMEIYMKNTAKGMVDTMNNFIKRVNVNEQAYESI